VSHMPAPCCLMLQSSLTSSRRQTTLNVKVVARGATDTNKIMVAACSRGIVCDTDLCGPCFRKLVPCGTRVPRQALGGDGVRTAQAGRHLRIKYCLHPLGWMDGAP
jgi:hypothetical protein